MSPSDEGDVFVWGYGILGKGPDLSESSTPERIPPALFGRSEFNPSGAVTRIRCGLNHFAAVTGEGVCFATFRKLLLQLLVMIKNEWTPWSVVADRGELFVWGKNVRGCLGVGNRDDQFFPWRVSDGRVRGNVTF